MAKRISFNNYKYNVIHNFGYKPSWIPKVIRAGISGKFYPNYEQLDKLPQQFGNVRLVWNKFCGWLKKQYHARKDYCKHHHINFSKMTKQQRNKTYRSLPKILQQPSETKLDHVLRNYKKKWPWLKKSDSRALQLEVKNLLETIKMSSNGKCRQPKFKSRKCHRQAYTTDSPTIRSDGFIRSKRLINMPKLGLCRVHWDRPIIGIVKQATVILRPNGTYHVSLSVECDSQTLPKTGRAVGIDMNLTYLAVLSTGQKYNLKHFYKVADHQHHFNRWQRKLSRRRRRAKVIIRSAKHYQKQHPNYHVPEMYEFHNYIKARQMVAKLYRRVHNQAEDYLQKITTSIVKRFDVICMEDLNVSQMVHNHHTAQATEHAYWHEFRRLIKYKCVWYGKTFIAVNKNNTTRCCWYCHFNNGAKKPGVEEWKCSNPNCPFHNKYHDRDINAAINILMLGLHWLRSQSLQPLYNYKNIKSNSALITGFNRADKISVHRRGIRREATHHKVCQ